MMENFEGCKYATSSNAHSSSPVPFFRYFAIFHSLVLKSIEDYDHQVLLKNGHGDSDKSSVTTTSVYNPELHVDVDTEVLEGFP